MPCEKKISKDKESPFSEELYMLFSKLTAQILKNRTFRFCRKAMKMTKYFFIHKALESFRRERLKKQFYSKKKEERKVLILENSNFWSRDRNLPVSLF
jgi:hypothetical protein